jgi:hypothetical protein
MKLLTQLIIIYVIIVLAIQTIFRWIYNLTPWGIDTHPSSGYLMTVQYLAPNNLTIEVTIVFALAALWVLATGSN